MYEKPKNIDGDFRGVKHGFHGTPLYKKWRSMRGRVTKDPQYINKGIKCCDEWRDFLPFKEWAEANGFDAKLTLDRIDTLGNYEPSNCRWVDAKTQAENQYLRKDNSTGYKGVSIDKRNLTYKVQIQVDKIKIFIGRFKTAFEAAIAFDNYITMNKLGHRKNFTMFHHCNKSIGV